MFLASRLGYPPRCIGAKPLLRIVQAGKVTGYGPRAEFGITTVGAFADSPAPTSTCWSLAARVITAVEQLVLVSSTGSSIPIYCDAHWRFHLPSY